jgi:hypothetical protein
LPGRTFVSANEHESPLKKPGLSGFCKTFGRQHGTRFSETGAAACLFYPLFLPFLTTNLQAGEGLLYKSGEFTFRCRQSTLCLAPFHVIARLRPLFIFEAFVL